MKRFGVLILFSILYSFVLQAQTTDETLRKGNQQYVLFESERDKGTDMDAAYSLLLDSYAAFKKVAESASEETQRNAVKARLKSAYSWIEKATIYYAEKNNAGKTLQFAIPYVEIQKMTILRGEPLPRSAKYPSIVYYSGVAAYKSNRPEDAALMFREYLNTGVEEYEKDSYMYLNIIYQAQKNYSDQENILERAIVKYPLSLDFLYNLVNVYIATKNMDKLLSTINKVLEVDPNDEKVLPIKARLLESAGKNSEALEIYQRLYTLYPSNFELQTGLARANFNKAVEIINSGATITDDIEYAKIRSEAMNYLDEAQKLFMQILEKQPTATQYMQGLSGVYKYLNLTPEYETINKIINDKGSYENFPELLAEYKRTHLEDNPTPKKPTETPATPVPVNPAKLVIHINDFSDANQNKVIDAGESFAITFTIENQGQGDAFNTRIRLSEQQGLEQYFDGAKEMDGGRIAAGTSKQYTMRFIASKDLPASDADINIYAFEANGFDADPVDLQVRTMDMALPRLTVVDYNYSAKEGTSIKLGDNGKLLIAVRNSGSATANNVRVNFSLPDNVFKTADTELQFDSIAIGDVKIMECDFVVNKRFDKDSIAILMVVTESTKSAYINDTYKVKIGQYLSAGTTLKIDGTPEERRTAAVKDNFTFGFKSDLLDSIPDGVPNPNRYAVIIGNEDYSRAGENAEINVPYAVNDATVFREYCVKTFGIPYNQIKYLPNATTGVMRGQLDWLINMASVNPAQTELFFFFSGHGNNDEATRDAYLIPVDVSGKNINLGISLASLYDQLGKYPVKGAYVFLDACFSGGFKGEAGLVAAKAVRRVAKTGEPSGNTFSISSSSGDQTSSVYEKEKQGYFTYFLIKTLQDAHGNIDLNTLYQKTREAVRGATALSGKMQEPQLNISPTFVGWETIKLAGEK